MKSLSPQWNDSELSGLSTLALAQLGDAVFELMVRTCLCESGISTARRLHNQRVGIVSASAQSEAAARLPDLLTEQELAVYNRGRNTQVRHIPKAATRFQYQAATALETLWGWLWLRGETERLEELFVQLTKESHRMEECNLEG